MHTLRIRETGHLKTVLDLYELKIHQKTSKPDYHELKTMVKRSIGQIFKSRNFEARNGRNEQELWLRIAVVTLALRED